MTISTLADVLSSQALPVPRPPISGKGSFWSASHWLLAALLMDLWTYDWLPFNKGQSRSRPCAPSINSEWKSPKPWVDIYIYSPIGKFLAHLLFYFWWSWFCKLVSKLCAPGALFGILGDFDSERVCDLHCVCDRWSHLPRCAQSSNSLGWINASGDQWWRWYIWTNK